MIKTEEESFSKTIDLGMAILNDIISKQDVKELSGENAFKLNDTYGFPIDLTREILAEKGIEVDTDRFYELLTEQKKRSRAARKDAGADAWLSDAVDLADIPATEFVGYAETENDAKVLALIVNGERENAAAEGDKAIVVLDKTSFYAESGGQVADTGRLVFKDAIVEITDGKKDSLKHFLHIGRAALRSAYLSSCCRQRHCILLNTCLDRNRAHRNRSSAAPCKCNHNLNECGLRAPSGVLPC